MSEGRFFKTNPISAKRMILVGLVAGVLLLAWIVSVRIKENAVPKGPPPTSQIPVAVKV